MKKTFTGMLAVLSIFLLVGCQNPLTNSDKAVNNKEPIKEMPTTEPTTEPQITLKEGKYVQIAPSDAGSQGEGYKNYLTLENNKATEFDSYFEITTEGTYTTEGANVTIHYTRNYGMTTYGEAFDDQIDRTIYCHIENDKIIIDSFSDFDYYDTGSIIYELIR